MFNILVLPINSVKLYKIKVNNNFIFINYADRFLFKMVFMIFSVTFLYILIINLFVISR